jgi:hypothetical protein
MREVSTGQNPCKRVKFSSWPFKAGLPDAIHEAWLASGRCVHAGLGSEGRANEKVAERSGPPIVSAQTLPGQASQTLRNSTPHIVAAGWVSVMWGNAS